MIRPTLSEAKEYAKQGYHMVPVCYEMLSDIITPINLLKKLKAENEHCYILESVENQELWGRYTFLGYSPKLDITCMNGTLTLKDENGAVIKETSGIHPEIFIREVLKDYKSPKIEGFPTFTGGLVGYFSYDYLKYSEKKLVLDAKDEEGFQDVDLMLFDKVIAFDNVRSKLILIANAGTANIEEGYQKALQDIKEMKELILHGAEADIPAPVLKTKFKPLFDKEAYCRMVEKAKPIYMKEIFSRSCFPTDWKPKWKEACSIPTGCSEAQTHLLTCSTLTVTRSRLPELPLKLWSRQRMAFSIHFLWQAQDQEERQRSKIWNWKRA